MHKFGFKLADLEVLVNGQTNETLTAIMLYVTSDISKETFTLDKENVKKLREFFLFFLFFLLSLQLKRIY